MQTAHPLKSLILYDNEAEIHAVKNFIQKFPSIFAPACISREIRDLHIVLNAESFDLTFFDETVFSVTIIEKFQRKLGVVVFKNKETASWKLILAMKRDGFLSLNPHLQEKQRAFIKALHTEIAKNRSDQASTISHPKAKLNLIDGDRTASFYEDDIIYIKVKDKLSTVYYDVGGEIESINQWYGLAELENVLDKKNFFRTRRNHIVNLRYLKNIAYSTNSIILTRKQNNKHIQLDVSYRKMRELKKLLKHGLEK